MPEADESPPPESQAARIVRLFGGVALTIERTGHPEHRIYNWLRSGFIPEKYRLGFLEAAARHGVDHTPFDYIAYMVVPRGVLATAA